MEEVLDIYDENWNYIGTASRSEVHEKGLFHQVVHCWVIAQTEPILYFQQRAHTKKDFPDCYDLACGGHMDAGEPADAAALREIREEIGLVLTMDQLVSLGTYRAPDFRIPGYYDREISHVYVYRQDQPAFAPGPEVGRMVCISAADFYRMEAEGAEQITGKTLDGTELVIRQEEWCCHDGEFLEKVVPYLKTAFPEIHLGGD